MRWQDVRCSFGVDVVQFEGSSTWGENERRNVERFAPPGTAVFALVDGGTGVVSVVTLREDRRVLLNELVRQTEVYMCNTSNSPPPAYTGMWAPDWRGQPQQFWTYYAENVRTFLSSTETEVYFKIIEIGVAHKRAKDAAADLAKACAVVVAARRAAAEKARLLAMREADAVLEAEHQADFSVGGLSAKVAPSASPPDGDHSSRATLAADTSTAAVSTRTAGVAATADPCASVPRSALARGEIGKPAVVASAAEPETEANDGVSRSLNSNSSSSSDQVGSMDLAEFVPSFDFGEISMLEAEDYDAAATDRSYGSDSSGGSYSSGSDGGIGSDSGEGAVDSDGYRTGRGGGKPAPRAGDEGPVLRMERPFDRGKAFGV